MAISDISATAGSALDPIAGAIKNAAAATGVDFSFLFQQAKVESGLNAQAKAGTSSASGLFQFTRDTWLKVVEQHGDDIGLSGAAASLRNGGVSAADRQKILDLRNNPEISARLAAHYAVDNAKALQAQGHTVSGPTDLYLAHFLGSNGAAKFLSAMKDNPNTSAASVLPSAASANKTIFYKDGAPVSVSDIYQRFAKRFDNNAPTSSQAVQVAAATLADSPAAQRVATVDSLVRRLKAPETLAAVASKSSVKSDTASAGRLPSPLNGVPARVSPQPSATAAVTRQSTPQPTTNLHKMAAVPNPPPSAAPASAPAPEAAPAPVSVDSLAKFLDSASKWSADPGKMDAQAKKGIALHDASEGIHSNGAS